MNYRKYFFHKTLLGDDDNIDSNNVNCLISLISNGKLKSKIVGNIKLRILNFNNKLLIQ